jgi:hypothetical protein
MFPKQKKRQGGTSSHRRAVAISCLQRRRTPDMEPWQSLSGYSHCCSVFPAPRLSGWILHWPVAMPSRCK